MPWGQGAYTPTTFESPPPKSNFSSFGDPNSFTAAAGTQAGDYDSIMKNYDNVINNNSSNPLTSQNVAPQSSVAPQSVNPQSIQGPQPVSAQSVTPQQFQYNQSPDVTSSLADLSNLATTGGYTPAGIADIRARDIAPTRSIYAGAQQNVQRSRALGGGYSPNMNATQAQMARDESSQIGDINTNANAGIAQNVAANELSASGMYAGAAGAANAAKTQAGEFNTSNVNQANEFNSSQGLQANEFNSGQTTSVNEANASNALQAGEFNTSATDANNQANANRAQTASTGNADRSLAAQEDARKNILAGIQGKTSLYGTTPALTSTFGNQVLQAGNLGQGQQQIDSQRRRELLGYG